MTLAQKTWTHNTPDQPGAGKGSSFPAFIAALAGHIPAEYLDLRLLHLNAALLRLRAHSLGKGQALPQACLAGVQTTNKSFQRSIISCHVLALEFSVNQSYGGLMLQWTL
jgi:hypothetical protein